MSSRMSINTGLANAAGGLPSPMPSSGSNSPCPPDDFVPSDRHGPRSSLTTLSHPPSISIPSVPYQQQQHQQQQSHHPRTSSGTGPDPHRRPSLPYQDGLRTPITPTSGSTPSLPPQPHGPPAVRHPLWRLECKSCTAVLCEQAMQGHLVGDPSKKLFSTNLAIGVLGLPDRPVSIICPCKFHLFACASCGSVCGYNLSQPCAGCETNRGNGHFWIFYAHEIVSTWRTIGDRHMFWDDLPTWCNSDGNVGR
ncbi:Protein fam72a [Actinomortierella ambigua]|uniref:Protein fam72a n=1 Tax=Actinomortierella ambigua TaxID=1343610 RepID=A0A9P6Q3X9_9FUNG|nr:Protein fam72a [Actinomortierella ambigua]KAG0258815.1 Protein fam72a [Actinomortierella ambigua]